MIKKITWPDFTFGPVYLGSHAHQELYEINMLKAAAKETRRNIERNKLIGVAIDKLIKEREFLYYLHSGRFPE